jgi:hypothetical protein
MKTRLLLCTLASWVLSSLNGFAVSYTLTVPAGYSLIANQLDNGIGNRFDQLFPIGIYDGDAILKYRCDGTYKIWYIDSGSSTGFFDESFNEIPPGTLLPGEGALFLNSVGLSPLTFSGALPTEVLPVNLPCGCGHYNMLARQTVGTGTYENVTGTPPQDGSQVIRWNGLTYLTNTYLGGTWSLGKPTILNIGEPALFFVPCPEKWEQIPDVSTNGLDVRATNPKILADDFRCTATGPITQIRIRGSWLNDLVATQACFCLGIWTDIPKAGTNYSRPGVRICNWCFNPGQYSSFIYASNVNEKFYDPNIPGTNGLIGSDTIIWEYVFDVPTNQTCIQTNGNIYWVSVTMDCVTTNLFGWKTCPTNFNDDAVFGHVEGINFPLLDWVELRRPGTTNSLDLSFTVTTTLTNLPPPPTNPPSIELIDKWLQIPDITTNGIDVRVTDPKILADDFQCKATGPITDIKFWASWLNDVVAPKPCFCIGFWGDIPVSITNLYSRPGTQLCYYCFTPGQYTSFPYRSNLFEQFFDPNIPAIIGSDTVIWEYDFHLPYSCWQTNTNIYWLSITADCFPTNQFLIGWKTCPTNWNDDAVYGHVFGTNTPLGDWIDLKRPPFYYTSLDLAFEILTETNHCTCTNAPIINCPSNIEVVSCNPFVSIPWSITASGICGQVTWVSSPPVGSLFPRDSTNLVTVVATDSCGNTNTCSFEVTVRRPRLTIAIGSSPGTVTISWPDGGTLQEATNIVGSWTSLPLAVSPYTVPASSARKFYRLLCP